MKRPLLALLLAAILSFPAGLFLYLQVQQMVARHKMEEKLEHINMQTISLPANAVIWYKKNKEIIVNDRLFDVKEYSISNGQATFTGLFDQDETGIKKKLEKMQRKAPAANTEKALVIQLAFQQLYLSANNFSAIKVASGNSPVYKTGITARLLTTDLPVPYPPPKI